MILSHTREQGPQNTEAVRMVSIDPGDGCTPDELAIKLAISVRMTGPKVGQKVGGGPRIAVQEFTR